MKRFLLASAIVLLGASIFIGGQSWGCSGMGGVIPRGRSIPVQRPVISKIGPHKLAPVSGAHRLVAILASYPDVPIVTSPTVWVQQVFGTTNSICAYFREVSYGRFTITSATETSGAANDGIVSVTVTGVNHPWTRWGEGWEWIGTHSPTVAREVLAAADPYINFAQFDANHDGILTFDELHLYLIIAGREDSFGPSAKPATWRHRWALGSPALVLDGVSVGAGPSGGYLMTGEVTLDDATPLPFGLATHELGHDLGLPDLYDTTPSDNPDSEGIGEWGLMGSGDWLGTTRNAANRPAHPCAWSKIDLGWMTPQVLTTSTIALLRRVEDHAECYVAYPRYAASGSEYFLLENRQRVGFDVGLVKSGPAHGLLIYHIDETVIAANRADNTVNGDETHKGVDVECADSSTSAHVVNQDDLDAGNNRGDAGDPWSASGKNFFGLATKSVPDSRLYSGNDSGIVIYGISMSGPTMTFNTGVATEVSRFRLD
jgi:M6 family metalloprotease-like protein